MDKSNKTKTKIETKEVIRCFGTGNELYENYHDTEWGIPVHDERLLFEMIILEGAHAGLSWLTILNKRETYKKAYDNFDVVKVSKYDEDKIQELLEDKGIVRHKLKVRTSVKNSQVFIAIQKEFGSFDKYIWNYVNNKPIKNTYSIDNLMPSSNELSDRISKDLKKRGMSFVGTTIMYAFLQAVGLLNDHLIE